MAGLAIWIFDLDGGFGLRIWIEDLGKTFAWPYMVRK